jgi:hypothetical protein
LLLVSAIESVTLDMVSVALPKKVSGSTLLLMGGT